MPTQKFYLDVLSPCVLLWEWLIKGDTTSSRAKGILNTRVIFLQFCHRKLFLKTTAQAHRHSVSHLSFVAYAARLMGHTKGSESVRGIMWWAEFPPVAESFPFLVSKAFTSRSTQHWDNWFCEIGRGCMEMLVVLMRIIQTPFHATFYFYSTVHFTGKYSAPVSSNFYSMTVTWQL